MDNEFICEICGEHTPRDCEGTEPNTCTMCMPITNSYVELVQKVMGTFKAQNQAVDKQ